MKKGFYSIGTIIILIFAALTFVLIPAFSGASEVSRLPDYGSFNGKPIRFEEKSDFFRAATEVFENYEQQGVDFGNQAYAGAYYTQAFSQAFTNIIGGYALEYYTETTGYKVPDSSLRRELRNLQMFKDSSGEFSPAIYKAIPEAEKRKAQQEVERNLLQIKSYQDIFGSFSQIGSESFYGLKSSASEVEFIRKMGEKLYSFDIAAFDMREYPEQEKINFGKAHKDLFVKYNLKVISLESESKAKLVQKRINDSEITFEDAITEYSTKYYGDPETGILSASYAYQITNAVVNTQDAQKITSLKKDEVSPIIETASGYCLFKSTDVAIEPDFESEQVISYVYSYLQTREKSVIEDYYSNLAKDFASKASSSSFETACNNFPVKSTSVAPFALNYNNTVLVGHSTISEDEILKFVVQNENFYKTAFKLKKDEISSPIILPGANQVLVVRCTNITTGGTDKQNAKSVITPEIQKASRDSINFAVLGSDKIKDNSKEFMQVFLSTGAK